ncbi:hypothetical protein GGR26_001344 [Lewinella marina]|uniref:DUF4832 domain-containing protein n=1 Tax=Neolewinella marina TaxID=438751 RepID=A0A2G0CFG7_9BACT|nr:hypothetical protein [Neolewinella marina]NJB85599.1 hypothetical protein [Neolewinella marina]PHK98716.1 hypothetical protein CGL56_09625 [Neolewinella marina]
MPLSFPPHCRACLFGLCVFLLPVACGPDNRQDIDLSDLVVEQPVDGVGHYVYAINLPQSVAAGESFDAQMEWRTVGGVDPNARYTMDVVLEGAERKEWSIPSGANTVGELHLANWLSYTFEVPASFPAGNYTFGVRLRDANRDLEEVPLGYLEELRMDDGYFRLGEIEVVN